MLGHNAAREPVWRHAVRIALWALAGLVLAWLVLAAATATPALP